MIDMHYFLFLVSWTALGSVLITGIGAGGPAVMIYSWLAICLLSLAVAYSMAEICSALPVAGGQYSWVAVLAPPQVSAIRSGFYLERYLSAANALYRADRERNELGHWLAAPHRSVVYCYV